MRGWWLRGEIGEIRDRFAPGEVATYPDLPVTTPSNSRLLGYTGSMGYRLAESIWADSLSSGGTMHRHILLPLEFTFRHEKMFNLLYQDLAYPTRKMDAFPTYVYTAGVNYHIKGHQAKIQVNYNWVNERDGIDGLLDQHQVREAKNNNFIVNFQVSW